MVKEVKKHIDLSLTVKWDSSKDGMANKIHKLNKKLKSFLKQSTGKFSEVDLLNMTKEDHTMTISYKTSKLDWHS